MPSLVMPMLLAAASAQPHLHLDMSILNRPMPVRGQQIAQVVIEQRVIIRIPTMPQQRIAPGPPDDTTQDTTLSRPDPPDPPPRPVIKEVKGPKCVKLDDLRGVLFNSASGITLVTAKAEYFRTHFDRMCVPASFYAGAYIEPNKDRKICAGRDTLHARNGSSCGIESFSKLVPAK